LDAVKVSEPISVALPSYGVLFAESVHATDFQMAERQDPFHKLFYVLAGRVRYHTAGEAEQTLATGAVVVVPQGQRHHLTDVEPSTLLLLCLTERFLGADPDLPGLWQELARPARRKLELNRPARERVERMWRRAMLEKSHAHTGGGITVRTVAAQLLVLLARQQPSPSADAAAMRVAAVARELRETFYDDWNVDRAASRAGLSRRRFTDLFRVETGRSFADELNNLRLEHAARLLRGGEHTVLGVMFSCGFSDVSHFYRLFRQRFGKPPKRWLLDQQKPRRR
jgi:AraC-like DNA-binding protein